jgi:hypothetical protein
VSPIITSAALGHIEHEVVFRNDDQRRVGRAEVDAMIDATPRRTPVTAPSET